MDELAELLKVTNEPAKRKPIIQEIGKRNRAGEKMQESHVTPEEQSNMLMFFGIVLILAAVAGACILVLML